MNLRTKQRQSRQPPKTVQQTTSDTSGHYILQSTWREAGNTHPHSSGCGNRHVHGSTNRGQNAAHAIPVNMSSTVPHGMWQGTSSPQQHRTSIRPRRLPNVTSKSNSNSNGQQHRCSSITSIHPTGTRQRRTVPQNFDGTSENNQATA